MEHPQTPALTPAMREALIAAAALVSPEPIPAALLADAATVAVLVGGGWLAPAGLGAVRLTPQGRAALSVATPDEEGGDDVALLVGRGDPTQRRGRRALARAAPHLRALAEARSEARDRPALLLALTRALILAVKGDDAPRPAASPPAPRPSAPRWRARRSAGRAVSPSVILISGAFMRRR